MPTPIEAIFGLQINLLKETRKALTIALAECPREVYVLALKGDAKGVTWYLCHSSLGYYFGSVLNAVALRKPIPDIDLLDAVLPGGETPIKEIVLLKSAIDSTISDIDCVIRELEQ